MSYSCQKIFFDMSISSKLTTMVEYYVMTSVTDIQLLSTTCYYTMSSLETAWTTNTILFSPPLS